MANEVDKNAEKEQKEKIKALEVSMKSAFKEGHFDAVQETADKLKTLDPENRLTRKLLEKIEENKKNQEAENKKTKTKEYETMLKKLYKEGEITKLIALAKELKEFNPESRAADKWSSKGERLQAKAKAAEEKQKAKEAEKGEKAMQKETVRKEVTPTVSLTSPTLDQTTPAVPVASTPAPAVPKITLPKPAAPEAETFKKEPKGNLFTKMFKKGKEDNQTEKSIIDTIVAKTDEKQIKKKIEKPKPVKIEKPKEKTAHLLAFAKVFANFTVIFIVFSAAFLYVDFLDENNTLLNLAGIEENTGSRLRAAADENSANARREAVLNKDIELYKGGYQDKALDTVQTIIDARVNWPDIFAKINEVTNSVYELNDFFKYIEYNNYSFDATNKTIRVTGTLSDPLGRNLTRLVELEEAFMYFPKDKNNPDDPTKPYFSDFREFTSFSKTLDQTTGRYTSNFQLSFALNE